MSTRDDVRAQRAEILARARDKGLTTDDLDMLLKGNPRTYMQQLMNLMNNDFATPGRQRLRKDTPPRGAFDGANRTFTLTAEVLGKNIGVDYVEQASGTLTPLTLTDNPEPLAGSFYLDIANGAILVGQAPGALDTLSVTYWTKR